MKNKKLQRGSHHLVPVVVAMTGLVGILGFVGHNTWQKQTSNVGGHSFGTLSFALNVSQLRLAVI